MEEKDNPHDVYRLVTKLCEKFAYSDNTIVSHRFVRKLRSKSYEILLSKKSPIVEEEFLNLEGIDDPFCQLLAWEFELIVDYDLKDYAEKLKKKVEELQGACGENNVNINNILKFLLQLRRAPEDYDLAIGALPKKSNSMFKYFDENKFKLPSWMICEGSKYTDSSFCLHHKSRIQLKNMTSTNFIESVPKLHCGCFKMSDSSCSTSQNLPAIKDEGYETLKKKEKPMNIWEIASKSKISERRTWENIGHCAPKQEKHFLTEAGPKASANIQHLLENRYRTLIGIEPNFKKIVPRPEFIKCLKYLLVGMASSCFRYDLKTGGFYLEPNVTMEGLTTQALQSFCNDLIFSGHCYDALNKMSISNTQNRGYIFSEFCENIQRYLLFYRTAAMYISETETLLAFSNTTRQLRKHLNILASICKVGPFASSEKNIPHGVALLNYLYKVILELVDREVIMVLYSILYPCCQVYFSRFLQQWIFGGNINDPYKEFFIGGSSRYISTLERSYWTKSFAIQNEIVPDFLQDLRNDILKCGKSVNLLKQCAPHMPFCRYLMGNKKLFFSCCLSSEELCSLEQIACTYYLEALEECGAKFSFENVIRMNKEQEDVFFSLVAKKRMVTLRRIELERLKQAEQLQRKKQENLKLLKQQYDIALADKEAAKAKELEGEIRINQANFKLDQLREKLVQIEANNIIEYYNKLFEASEKRRASIDKNIFRLKQIYLESENQCAVKSSSSSETYVSVEDEDIKDEFKTENNLNKSTQDIRGKENNLELNEDETSESYEDVTNISDGNKIDNDVNSQPSVHSSRSLDLLNANTEAEDNSNTKTTNDEENYKKGKLLTKQAEENFRLARKNKEKVLNLEMGVTFSDSKPEQSPILEINENFGLTDAQRNKLRVMSSEFGIDIKKNPQYKLEKSLSSSEINKMKNLNTDVTSVESSAKLDNENYLNKNNIMALGDNINITDGDVNKNEYHDVINVTNEQNSEESDAKNLNLNLLKTSTEPMSLGSTPLSDIILSNTPTKEKLSLNIGKTLHLQPTPSCSLAPTAASNFTEEGFNFTPNVSSNKTFSFSTAQENPRLSKRVTYQQAQNISTNCLKLFLQQSVEIPLSTQLKLVDNELLKYFINDLQYLTHLNSLRNYFFLLDGEFARNITEGLFEKLYDSNFPTDLINCRTLQNLVYRAIDSSCKYQEHSTCLSFKINTLPKTFNLGDPNVLDCLSLTYQVPWPLNILLPSDIILKYDEVFKFLIKLHRVSWVLKKIFKDLKFLARETGTKEVYLMLSPEYQKLHQSRHRMTHFMQTLRNYIIGDILQTSWKDFEKNLKIVSNFDELFQSHSNYVKNILFMCLLNQRSTPLRNIILNIFTVILEFYDNLRSKPWDYFEGIYSHPNFEKLEEIFQSFEKYALYFYRMCRKGAKSGYQPHLVQFLDLLDLNCYYSNKLNVSSSISTETSLN